MGGGTIYIYIYSAFICIVFRTCQTYTAHMYVIYIYIYIYIFVYMVQRPQTPPFPRPLPNHGHRHRSYCGLAVLWMGFCAGLVWDGSRVGFGLMQLAREFRVPSAQGRIDSGLGLVEVA